MKVGRFRGLAAVAAALALTVVAAACGSSDNGDGTADSGGSAQKLTSLRIMAPAAPGGGWDQTSRTAQQALEQGKVVGNAQVFNVPGAGGTIGLARMANEKGNANLLMTMGLVMVGAVQTNHSKATLQDVTPIARLINEYEIVVVPAKSPYKTLDDLVQAWKKDRGKVAVAGGSAGGVDQILAGLMAQKAGIDPKKVNYVAFSGGGEALAAILGGKVTMGISGVSEFADQVKSGKLRALAVSSGDRLDGVDAPTLKEGGLDVEVANWRGFVAPAGLDAGEKKSLVDAVTKMHDTEAWKQALAKNGWDDSFLTGDEFADYLDSEQQRVNGVLKDLGLV